MSNGSIDAGSIVRVTGGIHAGARAEFLTVGRDGSTAFVRIRVCPSQLAIISLPREFVCPEVPALPFA
jgi:hypothetical protein